MAKSDAPTKSRLAGESSAHRTRKAATAAKVPSPPAAIRDADVRAYNAAVAAARLAAIRLVRSRFSSRSPDQAVAESTPSASIDDRIRFHRFEEDAGRAFTVFEWELECQLPTPPFHVSIVASFMVIYDGLEGVSAETVERLVSRIGRFASYPYFRTFVAQTSGMAELDLPPLPMLRDQPHANTLPAAPEISTPPKQRSGRKPP